MSSSRASRANTALKPLLNECLIPSPNGSVEIPHDCGSYWPPDTLRLVDRNGHQVMLFLLNICSRTASNSILSGGISAGTP